MRNINAINHGQILLSSRNEFITFMNYEKIIQMLLYDFALLAV